MKQIASSIGKPDTSHTVVIAVTLDYALPAVIFPLTVYDMFTLMLARIVLHDVIISL